MVCPGRGAGVAERPGLENLGTRKGHGGSNPPLSAKEKKGNMYTIEVGTDLRIIPLDAVRLWIRNNTLVVGTLPEGPEIPLTA